MKNLIFIIPFLIFTAFTIPGWYEFKDYKGRFSVNVPNQKGMTERIDTIETSFGKVDYHTFFYQPADPNAENKLYQITYIDYPKEMFPIDSTELISEFLTTTVEAANESIKGKLMYVDNIKISNYAGKLWRSDYNKGNAVIKSKCVLVQNRLYTVQVATTKKRSINHEMDLFLDSFQKF